jgi:bifunctional non-homologous end joining protein LigD
MRLNLGQEFVIGGFTPGTMGFDSLVIGFYEGKKLLNGQTREGYHKFAIPS